MSRPARMVSGALLVVLLAACGSGGASPTDSLASPIATSSTSPVPTQPADDAPAELQGDWTTASDDPDPVTLTISRSGYQIHRGGGFGQGAISVDGKQIRFFGSDLCEGEGTYTWSIDDGVLTFALEGDDPCGNRSVVLVDRTYEPVE